MRRVLPARVYYRYVGRHEHGSMRLWNELVSGLSPGSTVLDVGAYHGIYALATREIRSDLAIFAFEPNENALEDLRTATAGKDITVVASAVSDRTGPVSFSTSGETSHVIESPSETNDDVTVQAIELDRWASGLNLEVSLMKVDIEGSEDAAFRGARHLMERSRPIVLCEVLTEAAGRRVAASLPQGYVFFAINEDRGPTEAPIPTRTHYRHKNWLLVPKERRHEIHTARRSK